tara:strand:+ start:105 stop:224 length:120 start_codon:yes stop_codon:yes gene_type:complete
VLPSYCATKVDQFFWIRQKNNKKWDKIPAFVLPVIENFY